MPGARHHIAVAAVSCALLLMQVSFTRLIGYKLFYHFVFLAIALSLLGLGAAGTFVALRTRRASVDEVVCAWLGALAFLVPLGFLLIANPIPIEADESLPIKLIGRGAVWYLLWASLLMVALNFIGGIVLTELFKEFSAHMGALYARDLLGASAGCLLSVALMKAFSPPIAFLAAAPVAALALVPFGFALRRTGGLVRLAAPGIAGCVLALAVATGPARLRDFEDLRTPGWRSQFQVVKHQWNHLLRTDHMRPPGGVTRGLYVLDGSASTEVVAWDHFQRSLPVVDPAYVLARQPPDVAIIGFGGGLQVAEARRAGAATIWAVDINPAITRWVLHDDLGLNLGLFTAPNIQVLTGEGRHEIRSSGRRFDVIVMHAIDTYAATATGAYALTENFLYTKEAILDFLGALNDGGVVSIQRWLFNPPRENLRLFVTSLEALEELGVQDPAQHIVMIAPIHDYELLRIQERSIWGYLLVSRTPFTPDQIQAMRRHVGALRWTVLYAPGGHEDTYFSRYVHAPDRAAFRASYPFVISPVTDARPYLFQFYNPLHRSAYARTRDTAVSGIYQSSAVLLLVALGLSVALTLALIVLPLLHARGRAKSAGGAAPATMTARSVAFFACLGIGYMALEVPLTQVLALYLGHPTYGFAVVLVALLVSSGVGSWLVERRTLERSRVCALVALVLALIALGIFPLVHATMALPDAARFAMALAMVGLCGVPMGFPLALGVRELGRTNAIDVAWAWGINAAASVVGSCLIMIVMVFWGSREAIGLGAACYAMAAWASRTGRASATPTDVSAPP